MSRLNCAGVTSRAVSDGLQSCVDLNRLCQTSGLPRGHIVAMLIWRDYDFHWLRMEADSMWSHKLGNMQVTTLDNSGRPIRDP